MKELILQLFNPSMLAFSGFVLIVLVGEFLHASTELTVARPGVASGCEPPTQMLGTKPGSSIESS